MQRPHALFVGDFNAGKSSIINALLRAPLLPAACEETTSYFTFVAPRAKPGIAYSALRGRHRTPLTEHVFSAARHGGPALDAVDALAVETSHSPFSQLVLVDSAGVSSRLNPDLAILPFEPEAPLVVIVVLDVEYWAARHSMNLLALLSSRFERVIVVANKSDQVGASDLRRIRETAADRISRRIQRPVSFHVASARLETARANDEDEYRADTKSAVRDLCDAGFDGLRLSLYEFEAQNGIRMRTKGSLLSLRSDQGDTRNVRSA